MNATSAQLQNPSITDTVNNGINEFIFVPARQLHPSAALAAPSRSSPDGNGSRLKAYARSSLRTAASTCWAV